MITARRFQRWKLTRTGPYPWVLAIVTIVLIFQLVRLFFTIVTPVGPVGEWRPGFANIIGYDERVSLLAAFDPYYRNDQVSAGTVQVTSLDLTLFGITLNRATGNGSAIIAGADGVQNSYILGDEVAPGAVLAALGNDHVWIESGGNREILYIDQSIAADEIAPGGDSAPVTTAAGESGAAQALSPAAIAEGIALNPRRQGCAVSGLLVAPQGDGQVFRQLGFQNGDVIISVNDRPVRAPGELMGQIRPGARLTLQVERGAGTQPLAIILE